MYISDIESNGIPQKIGGDNFDGPWVVKYWAIFDNKSIPASNRTIYSLSSYLPNDSYDYEVLFWGEAETGQATNNQVDIVLSSGKTDAYSTFTARIGRVVTKTASSERTAGSCILPIFANDRNVGWYNGDSNGTATAAYFRALGYRRLGKNT